MENNELLLKIKKEMKLKAIKEIKNFLKIKENCLKNVKERGKEGLLTESVVIQLITDSNICKFKKFFGISDKDLLNYDIYKDECLEHN